jgi:hypothetical protein
MSTPIDHEALAVSRLATEYRESANLILYIKALLSEANTLEDVFQNIITKRWLVNATDAQLDVLGIIVGQPRVIINSSTVAYFGFADNIIAFSFGSVSDPALGGRFRSIGEETTGSRRATNDEYKLFIKARIIKNYISPNTDDVIRFFKFLFDVDNVFIVDGDMEYTVTIGRVLTINEKLFLSTADLIPKVMGVSVTYIDYVPS